MFDKKRRTALLALGVLTSPATSLAGSDAPLRLAMVNIMPWAGLTPQGKLTGALVDLSAQLSTLSGMAITPRLVPYGRALKMLELGVSDLMFSIDTGLSSKPAIPLDFLITVDIALFVRDGLQVNSLADLHGKTIGYLRGTHLGAELRADPRIFAHPIDSYEQGTRMLRVKRLDGLIGVRESIEFALHTLGAHAEFGAQYVLERGKVKLYAAPAISAPSCAALQKACLQLRQDKTVEALLRRYTA